MTSQTAGRWGRILLPVLGTSVLLLTGCGPSFGELRQEGQKEMAAGNFAGARGLFEDAWRQVPEHAENMHDMGVCCMVFALRYIDDRNEPAAKREIDRAIWFFDRSITAHPGFRASLIGKNRAEELKGQFEQALRTADWAAKYVGPSAEQFLWLGNEYEERGDLDMALLRYRQAQVLEKDNPKVFAAIGRVQYKAGKTEEGSAALHKALELDPSNKAAADALREQGEPVPEVDLGP